MEAVKVFLAGTIGKWLMGGGVALLGVWAKKKIPEMISKALGKAIIKMLDVKDPIDRTLVMAFVVWAEKKVPERGKGEDKLDLVMSKLLDVFPALSKKDALLRKLIEECVWSLDDKMDAVINVSQTVPKKS